MSEPQYVKTQFRLPVDLHEKIVAAAAKSGRSMNAEIVHQLSLSGDSDKVKHLESLLKSTTALSTITAFYLYEVVKRVPPSDDELSNDLMMQVSLFAKSLGSGDLVASIEAIQSIMEMKDRIDPEAMRIGEERMAHRAWVGVQHEDLISGKAFEVKAKPKRKPKS